MTKCFSLTGLISHQQGFEREIKLQVITLQIPSGKRMIGLLFI